MEVNVAFPCLTYDDYYSIHVTLLQVSHYCSCKIYSAVLPEDFMFAYMLNHILKSSLYTYAISLWNNTNNRFLVETGYDKCAPFLPKGQSLALQIIGFHVAMFILVALLYIYIYLYIYFIPSCRLFLFLTLPPV